MSRYTARVGGHSWANGPQCDVDTVREGREFAESYGTTADWCQVINNRTGRTHVFRRDPNGNGTHWFKTSVQPAA